ncbi:NAD-dependent succinate-semialdehyde dehydrogenase [Pseudorhodobacter aquimaris]|uniref:NAD-dependent succinate-semialdehyde dehydrogenase n=1 Tax=Pseudorhodobacter aquimaris TaxID=687412 RepID=UPI00067DA167|nr:NAD-dependent succinate-semialdehyde dehydrogenase [Pseudorhodobacter aquimaris]
MDDAFRSTRALKTQAYFAGAWRSASNGATTAVICPATGKEIGTVPRLTAADVHVAIDAAAEAFVGWSARTAADRAQVLKRWHGLILQEREALARILTSEQGKPLAESRAEIDISAAYIEWFAEEGRRVYGDIIPSPAPGRQTIVTKHPVGVTCAITPWNFPASMITRKLAPALAAGCTMLVKPSERTPFIALALVELAEEAGVPPGVISVLTGSSREIIKVMTDSAVVRKLSFTGSTAVGKDLIRQCSDTVKRMSMELGGNAPVIIFDDADVDAAVNGLMALKFRNSGQTCVCANRIFVQRNIAEKLSEAFVEKVRALKVGAGDQPGVQIGPLINAGAAQDMGRIVARAQEQGAQVLVGGGEPVPDSAFYLPTVLAGVTPDMDVARDEIFGPIAPLLVFDDEATVVAQANDTPYGLASYTYTRDLARAWRVSDALEYGMVGINEVAISNEVAPFGGVKESGFGREGSRYGLDEYLDIKYRCMGGLSA